MTSTPNSSSGQGQTPVGAVLVAAGRSQRMGGPLPKIWLELGGEAVILHSLRALRATPSVGHIVVVANEKDFEAIEGLVSNHSLEPVTWTAGGKERADSVSRGLLELTTQNPDRQGLVLVHDAARPLVLPRDIEDLIHKARSTGSALLASPVRDSLHKAAKDKALEPVPRADLWAAETPQAMDCAQLVELLAKAQSEGINPTDEASLHEMFLGPISLVQSSAPNPKLTWASDLPLFEAILETRKSGRSTAP